MIMLNMLQPKLLAVLILRHSLYACSCDCFLQVHPVLEYVILLWYLHSTGSGNILHLENVHHDQRILLIVLYILL